MTNNLENINPGDVDEINKQLSIALDEVMSNLQNNYLNNMVCDAVDKALDLVIREICPDFIENQIINLKENLINYGLVDGIGQTVEDVINTGKDIVNTVSGNFESITQAQKAISSGGLIDNISDLLDMGIDKLKSSKIIDSDLAKSIKKEKNNILKNVEKNIETSFTNQLDNLEKLEKYIGNWKEDFEAKDFNSMQNEFNKMKKVIDSLLPIENTLNQYRTIENLQTLIKNNGKDFNLTEEEMELAQKLF